MPDETVSPVRSRLPPWQLAESEYSWNRTGDLAFIELGVRRILMRRWIRKVDGASEWRPVPTLDVLNA